MGGAHQVGRARRRATECAERLTMTKTSKQAWLRPTTRAERTLQDAQEHARQAGCGLVQSGHLLLALVQEPRSLSTRLLARLNVSDVDVRAEVARVSRAAAPAPAAGPSAPRRAQAEPSEQAWADNRAQMLDAARQEAQGLGDNYVGTEHLLLSLLRGTGAAGEALRAQGVTWEDARAALPEMKAEGLI